MSGITPSSFLAFSSPSSVAVSESVCRRIERPYDGRRVADGLDAVDVDAAPLAGLLGRFKHGLERGPDEEADAVRRVDGAELGQSDGREIVREKSMSSTLPPTMPPET